jgi:hypothetical protein
MKNAHIIFYFIIILFSCDSEFSKDSSKDHGEEQTDKRVTFFQDSLKIKKGEITPIIVTIPEYCGACNKSISTFINSQTYISNLKVVIPKESTKTSMFKDSIFLLSYDQESILNHGLFITTTKVFVFDGEKILYESTIHDTNIDKIQKDLKVYFSSSI